MPENENFATLFYNKIIVQIVQNEGDFLRLQILQATY